jgi:DNA-binding CsgD family transcriptional regulator
MARAALTTALEGFERVGARLWADNARAELSRGGAARSETSGLTPTQLEVAQLASAGRTNRQIAAELFMSPHTVEAHLSAAYRSLGIGSRAALSEALRDTTAAMRDSPSGIRDSSALRGSET